MTELSYRKREYLSYSTLLSFARCPRRFFYQKNGIMARGSSAALVYGTAMHKAVDIGLLNGLDAAVECFRGLWDEQLNDEKRNPQRAVAQLRHYLHTHQAGRSIYQPLTPPPSGVEMSEEVSPLEIPFVLDLGLPIPLVGRLDGWGIHRDTGEFWAREFKTTSRLHSSMFDGLELNPQILTYVLVCKTVTMQKIRGVMFDVMLIDKAKVESIIHPVHVPDHLVDDILLWLRYHGELLLACEARGEFPKNFAGCSSYPLFYQSGSHCEYENLCRVPDWRTMTRFYDIVQDHKMISFGDSENAKAPTSG